MSDGRAVGGVRRRSGLSQRARVVLLGASLALLAATSYAVEGSLIPGIGSETLWFYSAALTLFLSDLVLEPWYTRPADAVANAAAVLLASLAAGSTGLEVSKSAFDTGRAICVAVATAILLCGATAMVTLRPRGASQTRLHRSCYAAAATLGRARVVFSAFFAATATAAYAESPEKLLLLYLFGGLLLWTTPLQSAAERLFALGEGEGKQGLVVEEIAQPRTAFLIAANGSLRAGQRVLRGEEAIGTIVDAGETAEEQRVEAALDEGLRVKEGELLVAGPAAESDERVIGSVGRETSLDRLVVRAGGPQLEAAGLSEGGLIEAAVRGRPVLYQVVDVEVEGARPEGESRSKRLRMMARKLGHWEEESENFSHADWVPIAGTPARLASVERTKEIDTALVGRVPGTDFGTRYDPVTGTTHNTAILGILGIGKTTLAAELTWRTLAAGARVVVIDITNEYAKLFEPLFGPEQQAKLEDELNEAIRERRGSTDYAGDAAGNKTLFTEVLKERMSEFFSGEERLLIINPSRLIVTQDDGGFPDSRSNAKRLVSLNPAEVTAMIAQAILREVSGEISDELRACLVLEEAHSLAPEWNSTANDGEKQAATATARALMQGRKFGFGSIVVTQRTATVTKSILNQCNTVFAMRVYDQTGTEFLGNFIGSDYARLLANLPERTAVVFGKASSCHSPLLVDLNDSALLEEWRQEIAAGIRGPEDEASNG
jgi:uncharacterized protein